MPEDATKSFVGKICHKEKAKADLLELSKGMRSRMMANIKDMIKSSALEDPDMWRCARSIASVAVDQFLDDVEHEVERSIEIALLQQKDDAGAPGPVGHGLLVKAWYGLRAFVLRHYLPHDKSIYGKFKDKWFLAMYVILLQPFFHGVRVFFFSVVLFGLLYPARPDEYQMINFILTFKGMQFLTSGLVFMAAGAMHYFACYSYHKDELLGCIERSGPGASTSGGQLVDYLGSIVLVWITFFALPNSTKYRPTMLIGGEPKDAKDTRDSPSGSGETSTHWRLRRLLYYDMICFGISMLVLGGLTVSSCTEVLQQSSAAWHLLGNPQFRANIYWACVLYSMLSLPFALFVIPGLQKVLTHSTPTGYNEHGACVGFSLLRADDAPQLERTYSFGNIATTVAWVLRTTARGRLARGGEEHGEYIRGDFGRGLWASMTSWAKKDRGSSDAVGGGDMKKEPSRSKFWKSRGKRDVDISAPSTPLLTRQPGQPGTADVEWSSDSSAAGGFSHAMHRLTAKIMGRQVSTGPASPLRGLFLDAPLPVASVRLMQESTETREGVVYFCIEAVPDCSLDGSFGVPWHVHRRHVDFVTLYTRLVARTQKAALLGGQAPVEPLPQAMGKTRNWLESKAQLQELESWLERLLLDTRSHGIWARELRNFLGLGSSSAYCGPLPPVKDEPPDGRGGGTEPASFASSLDASDSGALSSSDASKAGSQSFHLKQWFKRRPPQTLPNIWEFIEPARGRGSEDRQRPRQPLADEPLPEEDDEGAGGGEDGADRAAAADAAAARPPPQGSSSGGAADGGAGGQRRFRALTAPPAAAADGAEAAADGKLEGQRPSVTSEGAAPT